MRQVQGFADLSMLVTWCLPPDQQLEVELVAAGIAADTGYTELMHTHAAAETAPGLRYA